MNTHAPVQSSGGAPPAQDSATPRRFDKTRKVLYWLSAVETWKRSARNVRHRASFPMLRALIHRERESVASPLEGYPSHQLEKSRLIHTILLVALSPMLLWSLVTLIKGVVVLIRFQSITTWLLYSVPLSIYLAVKLFVSYRSREAIGSELLRRLDQGEARVQNKEGSTTA